MRKIHKYTAEEKKFLADYVPGHSHKEIQAAFINKFGWQIKLSQIISSIKRYGLNTGRTGYFHKGLEPWNKGKKGIVLEGSEKGWFKKGNRPKNYRPVGSERINVDGYIEIKVKDPNKWKLKHRVVWEENHGKLKKSDVVIFLDGNKLNVNIDNLEKINRYEHLKLNSSGHRDNNPDITKMYIMVNRLDNAIKEKTNKG